MEIIRIPIERVKVLIGKDGATKEKIEKVCRVRLVVGSEGEVELDGDPSEIFFAKDVVIAIGRGFNPNKALKLAKDNYNLFVFHLREILPNEKTITRIKGRIIGENGKVKREMEAATQSNLSIYGNTIAIISQLDTMEYAKEAVQIVIDGAPHITLFNYLRKIKRNIFEGRLR